MKIVLTKSDIEAQRLHDEKLMLDHQAELKKARRSGFIDGVFTTIILGCLLCGTVSWFASSQPKIMPAPTPGVEEIPHVTIRWIEGNVYEVDGPGVSGKIELAYPIDGMKPVGDQTTLTLDTITPISLMTYSGYTHVDSTGPGEPTGPVSSPTGPTAPPAAAPGSPGPMVGPPIIPRR
jgi:hypothetical protein